MSRYGFRPRRRPEPRQEPKTTYSVCDNGTGQRAYPRSEDAARAMAICAARSTGYGAYSVQRDGQVLSVDRYRCDRTGDGAVYGWRYSRERFQDEAYVVAPAGMVLP